jgi:alpha-D-ribose 1-methylphosphonate 5-triphosphate synthase subunit PhnI
MYVAVKGGEKAITAAHALQEHKRRGDGRLPELSIEQITQQLNLAVDRVMTEGGIADRELAALALKQASGDNVEAIFLLRAYRTTLQRLAVSEPVDTASMRLERRISAVYKDIPGGQMLGPTYDYTHRLLDFTLLANGETPPLHTAERPPEATPHVFNLLVQQGWRKRNRSPTPGPTTSPARRRSIPAHVRHACSSWCAAMKAICWRWPTPPSAVTVATILSLVKFAAATSPSRSSPKSWVLRSISANC